jgi:hypothetical protein
MQLDELTYNLTWSRRKHKTKKIAETVKGRKDTPLPPYAHNLKMPKLEEMMSMQLQAAATRPGPSTRRAGRGKEGRRRAEERNGAIESFP